MNNWQRRIIGALTLGGGFTGALFGLITLLGDGAIFAKVLAVLFTAMYTLGVWCGIKILEGSPDAITPTRVVWLLQIPYLTSPVIGFHFFSGAWILVGFQSADPKFLWALQVGSHFGGSILRPASFAVGINLFALAVFCFLSWAVAAPPNNSFKPKPLRGSA